MQYGGYNMLNATNGRNAYNSWGIEAPKEYKVPSALHKPFSTVVPEIQVGNLLNYGNGENTSIQTIRNASVGFTAGGLVTAGAAAAGMFVLNPFAAAAGGIATLFSGATAGYYNTKPDLNSPKERAVVIDAIAKMSLSQIVEQFSKEEVINYNLLEGFLGNRTPSECQEVYKKFYVLSERYKELEPNVLRNKSLVEAMYKMKGGDLAFKMQTAGIRRIKSLSEVASQQELLPAQKRLLQWVLWKEKALRDIDDTFKKDVEFLNQTFLESIASPNLDLEPTYEKFHKLLDEKQRELAGILSSINSNPLEQENQELKNILKQTIISHGLNLAKCHDQLLYKEFEDWTEIEDESIALAAEWVELAENESNVNNDVINLDLNPIKVDLDPFWTDVEAGPSGNIHVDDGVRNYT